MVELSRLNLLYNELSEDTVTKMGGKEIFIDATSSPSSSGQYFSLFLRQDVLIRNSYFLDESSLMILYKMQKTSD